MSDDLFDVPGETKVEYAKDEPEAVIKLEPGFGDVKEMVEHDRTDIKYDFPKLLGNKVILRIRSGAQYNGIDVELNDISDEGLSQLQKILETAHLILASESLLIAKGGNE